MKARTALLAAAATLFLATAFAHETQSVGEGESQYNVIVGFATEPPYTEERSGLSLTVRNANDGSPVENLENSLSVDLIAPDGTTSRPLQLRARHAEPGAYTDDFLLTAPGVYSLHVTGFIGATQVDLTFEMHEVTPLDALRFP